MKIIHNNNYIEVECNHCRSILAVVLQDITYTEMAHHGSPYTAECGACNRTLNITSKRIPKTWIAALDDDV